MSVAWCTSEKCFLHELGSERTGLHSFGGDLFWTRQRTILGRTKGVVSNVASAHAPVDTFTVHEGQVFWFERTETGSAIVRRPIGGCEVGVAAHLPPDVMFLRYLTVVGNRLIVVAAVDDGHGAEWALLTVPIGGGAVSVVKMEDAPFAVTSDRTRLYYSTTSHLERPASFAIQALAPSSDAPITIAKSLLEPYSVEAAASGELFGFLGQARIGALSTSGGTVRVVATNVCGSRSRRLVADDRFIYWGCSRTHIKIARRDGSDARVLVELKGELGGLAIDATHVYWTESNANGVWSLYSRAKPCD